MSQAQKVISLMALQFSYLVSSTFLLSHNESSENCNIKYMFMFIYMGWGSVVTGDKRIMIQNMSANRNISTGKAKYQ